MKNMEKRRLDILALDIVIMHLQLGDFYWALFEITLHFFNLLYLLYFW